MEHTTWADFPIIARVGKFSTTILISQDRYGRISPQVRLFPDYGSRWAQIRQMEQLNPICRLVLSNLWNIDHTGELQSRYVPFAVLPKPSQKLERRLQWKPGQ